MAVDVWDLVAQRFGTRIDYTTDPARWVVERAKEHTWSAQRAILQALVHHRMVAVPSCHGVGKSHIASRAASWWIDTYGTDPSEVFLVTTAPTASQVAVVLWRYIGQVHRKAELPGRINRSPYPQWILDQDVVGYGRKPADYEESAFQGIHATHVLIVVDEACGILPGLWDQLSSLASNLHARILAIGNPTDPASHFASICRPDSDWHVIRIDGLRTPNMSEEATRDYPLTRALMQAEGIPFADEPVDDKMAAKLISPLYVEERIRAYCGFSKTSHLTTPPDDLAQQLVKRTSTSSMFLARVRGLFPTSTSEGAIPLAWAQMAMDRWTDWDDAGRPEQAGRRVVGIDVAYTGEDETVIAERQGQVGIGLTAYSKQDTVETADAATVHLQQPQSLAVVDVNGIGAGVYDTLRRYKRDGIVHGTPIPFNASSKTEMRDRIGEFKFLNDRAASWWRMRELLDPSKGHNIAIPQDEQLLQELTSAQYKVRTGAVIQIEEKDAIRKRLGRSPDRADAVILSFWMDGAPIDHDPAALVHSARGGVFYPDGYTPFAHSGLFDDAVSAGWEA